MSAAETWAALSGDLRLQVRDYLKHQHGTRVKMAVHNRESNDDRGGQRCEDIANALSLAIDVLREAAKRGGEEGGT